MNSQCRLLLETIEQNYNNEEFLSTSAPSTSLFVSPSNTHQQIFLQKLINIYVLRKKEYNKISQQRISHLMKESSGSFTDMLLVMRFMSYCMQNKIEVSYDKFYMLKLLTGWMDILEKIKKQEKINLCRSVLGMIIPENKVVSKVEQLIIYLNYIAVDLQQIIERPQQPKKDQSESVANIQQNSLKQNNNNFPSHLDIEDLVQFLNNILPKTLYNIVIPESLLINKLTSSMNPMQQKQNDFLFSQQSIEYFAKQKSHYQQLLKFLIQTILKFPELQQPLQRQFMLSAMRYLYLFNRNKHAESFSLFTKVYDKLSQAVKFALSDQFVLFFKIIRKIGHSKFIDYLRQKYPFIEELHQKLDTGAVVGYPKDSLNAFHSFPIMESIFVNPGTMVQRFIQILEPYSLLYFCIAIKSLDINVRFYYLGSFTSPIEKRQLLLNKEKCQIQFKGNIIALEKGIYMFEFDNSYSWMKGKSLLYDTMVLTALDLVRGDVQKDKFLNVLFNKFEMNSCSDVVDVKNIGNINFLQQQVQNYAIKQAEQQKLSVNMQYDQNNQTYNLKTIGEGKIYEYETDNQNLFKKKAHQIYETLQQSKGPSAFEWLVEGGILLTGIAMIEQWCRDPVGFVPNQSENKVQTQEQVKNQAVNAEQEKVELQQKQKQEKFQDAIQNKPVQQIPVQEQQKTNIQTNNQVEKTVESFLPQSFQAQKYPSLISQTTETVINTVEQQPQHQQQQNQPSDNIEPKQQLVQEVHVQQSIPEEQQKNEQKDEKNQEQEEQEGDDNDDNDDNYNDDNDGEDYD